MALTSFPTAFFFSTLASASAKPAGPDGWFKTSTIREDFASIQGSSAKVPLYNEGQIWGTGGFNKVGRTWQFIANPISVKLPEDLKEKTHYFFTDWMDYGYGYAKWDSNKVIWKHEKSLETLLDFASVPDGEKGPPFKFSTVTNEKSAKLFQRIYFEAFSSEKSAQDWNFLRSDPNAEKNAEDTVGLKALLKDTVSLAVGDKFYLLLETNDDEPSIELLTRGGKQILPQGKLVHSEDDKPAAENAPRLKKLGSWHNKYQLWRVEIHHKDLDLPDYYYLRETEAKAKHWKVLKFSPAQNESWFDQNTLLEKSPNVPEYKVPNVPWNIAGRQNDEFKHNVENSPGFLFSRYRTGDAQGPRTLFGHKLDDLSLDQNEHLSISPTSSECTFTASKILMATALEGENKKKGQKKFGTDKFYNLQATLDLQYPTHTTANSCHFFGDKDHLFVTFQDNNTSKAFHVIDSVAEWSNRASLYAKWNWYVRTREQHLNRESYSDALKKYNTEKTQDNYEDLKKKYDLLTKEQKDGLNAGSKLPEKPDHGNDGSESSSQTDTDDTSSLTSSSADNQSANFKQYLKAVKEYNALTQDKKTQETHAQLQKEYDLLTPEEKALVDQSTDQKMPPKPDTNKDDEKKPDNKEDGNANSTANTSEDSETDLCWLWILLACLGGSVIISFCVYVVWFREDADGELVSDLHDSDYSDLDSDLEKSNVSSSDAETRVVAVTNNNDGAQ